MAREVEAATDLLQEVTRPEAVIEAVGHRLDGTEEEEADMVRAPAHR